MTYDTADLIGITITPERIDSLQWLVGEDREKLVFVGRRIARFLDPSFSFTENLASGGILRPCTTHVVMLRTIRTARGVRGVHKPALVVQNMSKDKGFTANEQMREIIMQALDPDRFPLEVTV